MKNPVKPVELFLAIGLATTIGACNGTTTTREGGENGVSSPSPTLSSAAPSPSHASSHSEGGEGGEGGESGSTGDSDVDYLAALGLMKGHLIVAKELLAKGEATQAEPHIRHPLDELYSSVESGLASRQVADFKPTLVKLSDLAKSAPDSAQTKAALQASMQAIDTAMKAVPADKQTPALVMAVINQLLKTAGQEYQAAIVDDKIVEVVEYQDSRGFVLYAEMLYQRIATQMSQTYPDEHQVIAQSLATLKQAWPTVEAPAKPVKPPGEVLSLMSQIELNSPK